MQGGASSAPQSQSDAIYSIVVIIIIVIVMVVTITTPPITTAITRLLNDNDW